MTATQLLVFLVRKNKSRQRHVMRQDLYLLVHFRATEPLPNAPVGSDPKANCIDSRQWRLNSGGHLADVPTL